MDRYENPWRPNYEAAAAGMWLAVGVTAWVTADWWDLHAAPFRYLAVTALVMAVLWLPGTLRVWRRHHRLRGKPLAFIARTAMASSFGSAGASTGTADMPNSCTTCCAPARPV